MKSDIEIARAVKPKKIIDVAKKIGLKQSDIELYGDFKCKINSFSRILSTKKKKINSTSLVLVTAINPTPAGEGKTTTTIGLSDALNKLGKKSVVALREPSLGPVFGLKGGACGGGYAQVIPMDEINLHFTGDFHAIESANNLIAAMIDNHIFQGNELNIDKENIIWHRCMDMNDRQLRHITIGEGGPKSGVERKDAFDITVASEIMAIFCLASDYKDLRKRIDNIIVAYDKKGNAVTVKDIKATGAVLALLKDAFKPNLVQTLEGNPAIIHGGPFANIAHGCNSVVATKLALAKSDIVVTEAGFGADLGAEKFIDIKCRKAGLNPSCVVLVATIRALKYHGNGNLKDGIPNLIRHIENIKNVFNLPCIVAINSFPTDKKEENELIISECKNVGASCVISYVHARGGKGGLELAKEVIKTIKKKNKVKFAYDLNDTIENKIINLSRNIYGADNVAFSDTAKSQIKKLKELKFDKLPICVAKTQYSFSDNKDLLSAPKGFDIHVSNVKVSSGAGFIVVYTGNIMTMPGLPKKPAAINIDLDKDNNIVGIF